MASADASDLDTLDKVRLVLDYAPAEAVDSLAEDDDERELLATLGERLHREVEVTRVRDATVVVERPSVVELLGVACPECGTPFEVDADGPLPRPQACPSCQADGTLEPEGEAAVFTVPTPAPPEPEPEPEPPEPEDTTEEGTDEPTDDETGSFAVPDDRDDRHAILTPADEDAAAAGMEPAVDPVDALTPDEPEEDPEPEPAEGLEVPPEEDEEEGADDGDEEYTFTPPTAQEEEETDDAVQDLLDEDFGLDVEDEEDDEERPDSFDEVDWPEEEETEDKAFDVVAPLDEDPAEAEPEEEDWPEAEPVDDDVEEPEWPELAEEDEEEATDEDAEWPELADEEGGEEDDPGGTGDAAEASSGTADDEVPSEWAGRDLDAAEDEPDDGPAAGARGGLPVDQLGGVTAFYAEQLEKSGYETTADLAAVPAREVSGETGIADAMVERWRTASTLVQELGLGAGYASLLAESDEVDGPKDLQGRDPGEVAELVNSLVAEADGDLGTVSADDVSGWIGGA